MSNKSSIAISISNLSKRYLIGKKKDGSLRGTLSSIFKTGNASEEEFWALNNINFDIQKGDVIGIIGKNGAGKSTLLKILSQITQPTTGRIEINGRVASLLEVGTGFHPELTGRENIFLNGTILGMTRKEVANKFDEIVAFSGIEKFIDTPVKRYSSGMYVRLAFAVAAHLEPEILIIDEVLAVGDAEFQRKCIGKMQDVAGEGRTVIFVSHHMGSINSLCNKCVLLSKGEIIFQGPTNLVVEKYINQNANVESLVFDEQDADIYFSEILTCNDKGELSDNFAHSDSIRLRCSITVRNYRPSQNLEICLLKMDKSRIFTVNSPVSAFRKIEEDSFQVEFKIPGGIIAANNYSFYCGLNSGTCTASYHYLEDICQITVNDDGTDMSSLEGLDYGSIIIPSDFTIIK